MTGSSCRRRPEMMLVIAASVATTVLAAQAPPLVPTRTERRFEAAAVKPALAPNELAARAASGGPAPAVGIRTQPGGRFLASCVTLQQLIARAFGVWDYQIDGGPSWITTDYFDVAATAGGDTTPAEFTNMLRALLAERFALRAHMETRQVMVQTLRQVRSDNRLGAGIQRTSPECDQQIETKTTPPPVAVEAQTRPMCGSSSMTPGPAGVVVRMGGAEIWQLVNHLMSELSAPVVDQTGLTGRFDITLEHLAQRRVPGARPTLDPTNSVQPYEPLTDALRTQLGLKLEKDLAPLMFLVVDTVARPTPD